MTNYRKILEMHFQGFSQRSIEANVHSSHQTVKAVLDRAKELNISCPLDDDITNEVLDELFNDEKNSTPSQQKNIMQKMGMSNSFAIMLYFASVE